MDYQSRHDNHPVLFTPSVQPTQNLTSSNHLHLHLAGVFQSSQLALSDIQEKGMYSECSVLELGVICSVIPRNLSTCRRRRLCWSETSLS